MENLIKRTEGSGLTDKDTLAKVIKDGSVVPWVKEITALAEKVVLEAFATGGFGKWAPLRPETLARKKNHDILVESHQLRDAITSEVK
jgi:phage gpG-like protein